jgi:anaerobic selenocysteine-containing dehydrogenase
MILVMTNPLRSAANSAQLEAAFAQLDFLVAIDIYINETTRHAHLILPAPTPAEQSNYEFGLYHLSIRNIAKWSSPAVAPPPGTSDGWQVLLKLSAPFMGLADKPIKDLDDAVFAQLVAEAVKANNTWPDLTASEVTEKLNDTIGPERVIDMLIRLGPYGDGFGRRPEGLTLAKVKASEHGIDLGPLQPRLREILNTKSGMIELAPPTMLDDIARLRMHLGQRSSEMLLIGRRVLRSSNSFMHNLPSLVKGPDHCTLQISRQDATRIGLIDGDSARVTSRVGSVVAPIEVTEDLMPGVVSLPHGWGHNAEGSQLTVAKRHAGVNINALTDNQAYDKASGTAVLFGTPVTVEPNSVRHYSCVW